MAYYNTTIWIIMMLVIVRLSSTMHGDDKEASLKQKLLDEHESESSSAEPEDIEIEFSKLILTGSSRLEPTDTITDSSKQKLIDEYNYLQTLNRGSFASPQICLTEWDTIDKVRDTLFNTIKELDCNYMYDMLVFMKLMTPENYTNEDLLNKVDSACSNWARHMLNARVNSGFPSREIPDILWMFYLYTKKMKMFAMRDAKEEMNYLQRYTETNFEWQKNKCQFLWPKCNKYVSFAVELKSLDENSALEKTVEACTHLSVMSESNDKFILDLDKSLYINNVTEDTVIMKTLITSFGGLDGGPTLLKRLNTSMITAKNPMTTLSEWIHSLKDVHYYFLRIVKTIMLRIWWASIINVSMIENSQSAKQVETLLYKQHLYDFACLFQLNDEDVFMKLIQFETDDALMKAIGIMSLLEHYDTEMPNLHFKNYYYSEIIKAVNCQTSTLLNIANSIGYNINNIQSLIRESILCAEVFVEYLKKILSGVNFNILQSFDVFYGKYKIREHVL